MDNISIFAKILGSFFYYPLTHNNNRELIRSIKETVDLNNTPLMEFADAALSESDEDQNQDFLQLFEGCDVMYAPPWGSVYLDKEEVVFGDSTLRYRQYLKDQQIELDTGMREPEDQFGLMLFALSQLIEKEAKPETIKSLIGEHLLPWAYRYLELVKEHASLSSYKLLSDIASNWLKEIQVDLDITPTQLKLYR